MNRIELIEGIYEKRKHLYRDVRHLCRPDAIYNRMTELACEMRTIPPKKQARSNLRYRLLLNEYKLLKSKLMCLAADEKEGPYYGAHRVVRATDMKVLAGCPKRDAVSRKAQTVTLLHFIFHKYSDERLGTLLRGTG
jgi:hypothetical protein